MRRVAQPRRVAVTAKRGKLWKVLECSTHYTYCPLLLAHIIVRGMVMMPEDPLCKWWRLSRLLGVLKWRKKRSCCRRNGRKLKGEQSDHPYPQMSSLLRASP